MRSITNTSKKQNLHRDIKYPLQLKVKEKVLEKN